MSRFNYKKASKGNKNAVNLMVTAPPMGHFGIISIFYAYANYWHENSHLIHFSPFFFIGAGLIKSAEEKKG